MKSTDIVVSFDSERLGYGRVILRNPHRLGIPRGITAIYGVNGSGKTTLATIMEKGRFAYGNRLSFAEGITKVKMLSFSDIHTLSGMEVQYYHQRMEATMNDYVPSVRDIMGDKITSQEWRGLCATLGVDNLEQKKVNYLSSGELRKLLIINALLDHPDLLILDNPYIGLDAASRLVFDNAMKALRDSGLSVVLAVCDRADIPAYADALLTMDGCSLTSLITSPAEIEAFRNEVLPYDFDPASLPLSTHSSVMQHDVAFAIRDGHIRYGDKVIFQHLDWQVRRGECWALKGRNGSGKSLLLSMVCGDNPQAYANDIILFDRKRGSGESIWEIKDCIGYVSPEMQLYFKSGASVLGIVIEGMRNSLNRYRRPSEEETALATKWLELLGIDHLAERRFNELSSGEQRLTLVARAMIRQPALLVLDEPLHGLDASHKRRILDIADTLHRRNNSSLIFVTHYDNETPACVSKTKVLGEVLI
jgi:molybdate transport system ATP-binding protein